MPKIKLMKLLKSCSIVSLAIAALICPSYASAKTDTDNGRVPQVDGNVQFPPTRWQLVKQTFVLNIPRNSNPITQIIIAAPSTVAVSNDIDVLEQNGKKININISVDGRNIILAFPEPVVPGIKLVINLNQVEQPIGGPTSIYRFSAKVVGSDAEIPVGVAGFRSY